ncbi:polysialyltransferase family glycosyltransferase [Eubacterium maltosivorans]|uniref:polysialyltransferase family glycosyltransferase n=1 Tax=Eubacterium maltosivorans TaxID=2041044 RepID=UPI00189D68B5|nr:polysialyltransferase family glycosyltransferase [Eubacterium maltosivorans]
MKKVLFVIETYYQLMYASIINYYLKINSAQTYIILCLDEKEIKKINLKENAFDKIIKFENRKKHGLGNFFEQVSFVKKNRKIWSQKFDVLALFNDSRYLDGYLIKRMKKEYSSKIVLLEEGLALYLKNEYKLLGFKSKAKYFARKILAQIGGVNLPQYGLGYHISVDKIALYSPDLIEKRKAEKKELIKLPNCSPPDKIMRQMMKIFNLENETETKRYDCIYFGQSLSELEGYEKENEDRFLNYLDYMTKQKKLKIAIKPHPFEDVNKYKKYSNFYIIENNIIPAEILFYKMKIDIIITPFSSAARNINIWWKNEPIYIFELLGIRIKLSGLNTVKTYDEFNSAIEKKLYQSRNKYKDYLDKDSEYSNMVLKILK